MINNIEIKNWRTHYDSNLEFEKGTNVIIGIMGSGKSSIINALSYGLFGTFPALKNRQVTIKEIIMNRPNKQDTAEVKLSFEHNKEKYFIQRILKEEGTNEAKIFSGDKLIAGPKQKDVNEKIEQILGLNYELFSRAVYAEQNEIDFFLKLSPGERKKKFDELLELEKYETARKNTIYLKNQLQKENKQKKEYLEKEKSVLSDSEEQKISEELKKIDQEIIELERNNNLIKDKIKIAKEDYSKIEQEQKEHQKRDVEIKIIKSTINNLQKEIQNQTKKTTKEISEDIIKTKENIQKIKQKKDLLKKEIEEFEKTKNKLVENKSVNLYKINQLKKEILEISSLKGSCPTCKKELDNEHKKTITEKLGNEKSIIEKNLIENKKNFEEINNLYIKSKKEYDELEKNIEQLNKKEYELEEEHRNLIRIDKIKNELIENKKILENKEDEIKKLKFDENELIKKQKEYFETKNEEKLNNERLLSKIKLKENLEFTFKKIQKIKINIKNIDEEITNYDKAIKKLGIFESCLISTQIELREELLQTINIAMSNVWQQIYPYQDYLDVKLKIVDSGYDLQVQTRNKDWVRVEGILSGGERSAAALCIRIAFSLVLTKQLSIVMLDEPTHNLDKNAIEKLSNMLREDLPKLVDQIFIITHEKELENASNSKIYLLNRNKSLDEATRIEELSKK